MLKIRAMKDGFRRAGERFSTEGDMFDDGRFTPEQLAELKAEPMLEVQHIEQPLEMGHPAEEANARAVLEAMTNDKLKADCDAMGIAYPANATKAQLVDLILTNTAPVPEA